MRVFDRMGRMLRADAHGLMDRIEERPLLLKQHLREAELELDRKRARLEGIEAEAARVAEERRRLEAEVARLDEDVEIARSGDDPELARFAIRRWLPRRDALRDLVAVADRLERRRAHLGDQLARQEAELAALRPRIRAALTRPIPSETPCPPPPPPVSEEEVELELIRRRERREPIGEGEEERR